MKTINIIAGMLASAVPVHAAVPMNDQKVVEVSVSNRGLTRLSVKGDAIQDIFVYPLRVGDSETADSLQLHKSGHVFMAPEGIKQPFYLTVITRKGHVQDLKLLPSMQKSELLVLMLPVPDPDPEEQRQQEKKVLEKQLLAVLQGIPPLGFIKESPKAPSVQKRGDLTLSALGVYRSEIYRLRVFDLENTGDQDISLMPEFFLTPSDLAVVFEKPVLASQGKARMAVLSKLQSVSSVSSGESFFPLKTSSLTLKKGKVL